MSDTILWISRSSSQANFLNNFYGFTTILQTWNLEILHDYTSEWFDVALLSSWDEETGILVGVVNANTMQLSAVNQSNIYHNSVLWYRLISDIELIAINSDPNIVYDYDFFPDKLFRSFNIRDFQLESFNSGALVEMQLDISPNFNPNFLWESWSSLPQDEIFTYSLVF